MTGRSLSHIDLEELARVGVWRFVTCTSPDEIAVVPVRSLPVRSLRGRVAASRITLANGERLVGVIGNLDLKRPDLNEHFLTLSVFDRSGRPFHLARYHDPDAISNGPVALAAALGLRLREGLKKSCQ